jgi:formylglycine-generating enzyme required for sulfatase activity
MKSLMILLAEAALIATSAQVTFGQNASAAISSAGAVGARTVEENALNAFERPAKHHPWVNSLGMKFVPVVGTQVLFSVWDTRMQDFMLFARSTGYDAGTGGSLVQGSTYPVVLISWNDAQEFCKWLTKRERSAGDLPQSRE